MAIKQIHNIPPRTALLVIITVFLFEESRALEGNFHVRYESWVEKYKTSNDPPRYCKSCLELAENKARSFSDYSQMERDAVVLINLYTQNMTDDKKIYKHLNSQLRSGHLTQLMREYKELLGMSITMLSSKSRKCFNTVFRGTDCQTIGKGKQEHVFPEFLSTSTDVDIAFGFGFDGSACKELIVIKNVMHKHGLFVEPYSDFPDEGEVLLKSSTKIRITKYYDGDKSRIKNVTTHLGLSSDVQVYVEGFVVDNKRRKKRSIACLTNSSDTPHPYIQMCIMMIAILMKFNIF